MDVGDIIKNEICVLIILLFWIYPWFESFMNTSVWPGYGSVCPEGNYCPVGTELPVPCPSGTYQDETGQSFCKGCPAGED